MKYIVYLVLLIALIFIVDFSVVNKAPVDYQPSYFDSLSEDNKWIRTSILSIALFMGIIAGQVYLAISKLEKVRIKELLVDLIADPSLWKALLGAPIIFAMVYSLSKDQPDLVLSVTFAFENGFFSHLVLSKREKSHA